MRQTAVSVFLVLVSASVVTADGPETGVLTGTVATATGEAIPGVTVTLKGDAGSHTTVSDQSGNYRFALLRPGSYAVSARLDGFQDFNAVASVGAGGKAVVSVKMVLGTSEEITVTDELPLVDKYNVSVGGSVKAETVAEVAAVNRGIYGSINVLPGVTNDQESADLSSSRPSFNGTPWQESGVFIDGVDTTFTRYGATRMFVPSSATSAVDLQAGGSGAEYGRLIGGVTNVVVKSGTNNFHGEGSWIFRSLKWDANNDSHPELTEHATRPRPADFFTLRGDERDISDSNVEFGVGGPIKRDKAWFFASAAEISTFTRDRTLEGDLIDQSTDVESYIGKLNFQPGSSHQLSASFIQTPVERLFQLTNFADQYVPTLHDLGGALVTGNWNWSISPSLFLETKIATHTSSEDKLLNPCECTDPLEQLAIKQADERFPANPFLGPSAPVNNVDVYLDVVDNTYYNGWFLDNGFGTNEYPRDQANVSLTQFAGKHDIRYGIDWQETEWEQDVERNDLFAGGAFIPASPFGFAVPTVKLDFQPADVVARGKGASTAIGNNIGLFVRDRFDIGGHWTFNLGLRIEDQTHENDIGRTVIDSTDVSPRFTGVYDIHENGKQLVSVSAGRYYTHIPQELVNSNLLDEWNGFNATDWLGFVAPGSLPNLLGFPVGYTFPVGGVRPGAMWDLADAGIIDIEIDPYGRDELIVGYEWQFSRRWAFKAKGIYWETFDQIGAGLTQLGPDGNLIEFTENVSDFPSVMRAYGWIDAFVADGRGTAADAERALASFDDARRRYQGIQLELNKRFGNGWGIFNNITIAETEGNHFGGSFNNTADSYGEQLHLLVTEADITECNDRNLQRGTLANCEALRSSLGLPLSTVNRFGRANREKPVVFKSYGYKSWNLGKHTFNLGGQFTFESGVRWSLTQPGTEAASTANAAVDDGATLFIEERGGRSISGREQINLSGAWGFPVRGEIGGEVRLEITNLTDNQDLVGVSTTTGRPSSSKRSWAQPRKFRLLTTFRF